MSEVFIYDDALSPVNSSLIQIVENDFRGKRVDVQSNAAQPSGLYGAVMKLPSPMGPVGFWVDDTMGTYAPTGLEYFNPGPSLRLDVTLFPLPAAVAGGGGGGGGPGGGAAPGPDDDADDLTLRYSGRWRFGGANTRFNDLRAGRTDTFNVLGRTGEWSDEEKRGVGVLIATIAMARTRLEPDFDFMDRLRRWESWLERLVNDERHSRGGEGSGGPSAHTTAKWKIEMPLPTLGFGEGNMLRMPMEEER